METSPTSNIEKLSSLQELLNLEFHIDYYSRKDKNGRLDMILEIPIGNAFEDSWMYTVGLDFWNFNISINGFTVKDIVANDERIYYTSRLTDIYVSLVSEIENELAEKPDPKINKLFLISLQNKIELFLGRYYNIKILERKDLFKPLDGIWHNSVVLIPNDKRKHLPDTPYTKAIISIFLQQQKQIIENLLSWLVGRIQIVSESSGISFNNTKAINTSIQWKRSDTDLLELIVALNESGSIYCNNSAMSRKQTIEFFENLFSLTIKDPESKLSRATERKKDPAPYLTFLKQTFDNYSKKKLV
jgi:hypothetical protein